MAATRQYRRFNIPGPLTCGGGALALTVTFVLAVTGTQPAQGQTYIVLHTFQGSDGSEPLANLTRDSAGNLYGTTYLGGAYGAGTVFKLDTTRHETVLHSFTGGADGGRLIAGVIRDAAGNLYGIASEGGDGNCPLSVYGCGVVFKVDTTGLETVLHTFTGLADGGYAGAGYPVGGLILDAAGNLYGTTNSGGGIGNPPGNGVAFKLDMTAKEAMYNFKGGADGANPQTGLIRDSAGNFYGTTSYGGGNACGGVGCGVVFKLAFRSRMETVLHSFADGATHSALVRDSAGNFYGTTMWGGSGYGSVFGLDTAGNYTVIYSFTGGTDGANPQAGVTLDSAGNLYGTTYSGGYTNVLCEGYGHGCGVVYKVDTTGKEAVLHTFRGPDGAFPWGGVIRDAAGNLYGTTEAGGPSNSGVAFKLKP